ncbi:hypothetical protein K2173_016924 [Erythroxylum novogranatense]|uniref:Uncharacterized protein n=1 Tax=Erythroxylum novogranatense TaxID=1862640 RepID=A0AAV8U5F0_9ROSI|nr:hypothetical protein K2173_016924 [Erythroxylum novogranatense]
MQRVSKQAEKRKVSSPGECREGWLSFNVSQQQTHPTKMTTSIFVISHKYRFITDEKSRTNTEREIKSQDRR